MIWEIRYCIYCKKDLIKIWDASGYKCKTCEIIFSEWELFRIWDYINNGIHIDVIKRYSFGKKV